ncbi:hypothetical protein PAP_03070 [Palaeococcus pacificus DY20341]|uniref:Pyrolysin n=1 Tax=Palaeococcus pacificus DY20341 TaxID=1343739 RepID=A0A075LRS8_9EURY|nr:hypothetical protein [Palaeococcus pacificus]AIF69034.1 hypothetical protein PAP_03070 [Palaeococcus pacificus DY20341]
MRGLKLAALAVLALLLGVGLASAQSSQDYAGTYYASGKIWYYLYLNQNKTFTEVYDKAVQIGVDNQTLTLALELQENATKDYEEAVAFGTPETGRFPIVWKIRRAYLNLKHAVELLNKALADLS